MIILFIAVLIIGGLIALVAVNRAKRKAKMNPEKLKLVEEGKKELSIFINLKKFLPIAIAVIFIILNIALMNYEPEVGPNQIIEVRLDSEYIIGMFNAIKYTVVIYIVIYLMLMYRIKKISTFTEEKRTAMTEYYGGRTVYLILTCIVLFILGAILSLILTPAAVNVI